MSRGSPPEFGVEFDFDSEKCVKNFPIARTKNLGIDETENPKPYVIYALFINNIIYR